MRVAIAGGGTAGHVNPALALAIALGSSQSFFVGTERGVESQLVPAAGFDLETIEVTGFDRARPWTIGSTGYKAARAVRQATKILKRLRPRVVVGMGGYVSLPVCFAAAGMRIPVLLHEQNIVLGLANKVCRPLARKVAVSFPETLPAVGSKGVDTGNPVLPRIAQLDVRAARSRGYEMFDLDPALRTILVFGGSLGAARINHAAAGLPARWRTRQDLQVLHITGPTAYQSSREAAGSADDSELRYRTLPYVEDMGAAYAVADLAVCRGGATTVAELTVVGVPSIIVPYPYHRDRQQELHAGVLERAGAAKVLSDAEATADSIATLAESILDPDALARMRAGALSHGRPEAADSLAGLVRQVAGS